MSETCRQTIKVGRGRCTKPAKWLCQRINGSWEPRCGIHGKLTYSVRTRVPLSEGHNQDSSQEVRK